MLESNLVKKTIKKTIKKNKSKSMLEQTDTLKEELKDDNDDNDDNDVSNKTEGVEEVKVDSDKKSAENGVLNFLIKDIGYGSF